MFPHINVFGFEIQTYSILAAVGFIVTALLAVSLGKKRDISPDKSLMATLVSAIGIFAGGHVLFALTNIESIASLAQRGELSFTSLLPYISGMVFYGGLFGAIIAVLIYTKINKGVSKADIFDIFAVSVPLFHAFGRVGCFFAGCCYGIESDFGFATYLNTSPAHYGISRFPVALFEALANILIFAFLLILFKRKKAHGKLTLIYLSLYAPVRFILEFFRGDAVRGFIFGLSTSQFISLLIIVALVMYCILIKFIKKSSKAN